MSLSLSRRGLLGGAAAASAALSLAAAGAQARNRHHRHAGVRQPYGQIGVQLYTVRDAFNADPLGTLQMVKVLGYDQVEMIGLAGKTAPQIKAWLDALGLTARSGHIGDWYNRAEASLDELAGIGAAYAVMPWMPVEERTDWPGFAAKLNHWGELARARGLKLAYHNHDFEFAAGSTPQGYDVLLADTDPALVWFELDVYWAAHGGRDPVTMIHDHADRIRMLHLKDLAKDRAITSVGAGTLDFPKILSAAKASSVDYVFVEDDNAVDPFDSINKSIRYLKSL